MAKVIGKETVFVSKNVVQGSLKERYNPYQTGNGVVLSAKDKKLNRRSKLSQKERNAYKQYMY